MPLNTHPRGPAQPQNSTNAAAAATIISTFLLPAGLDVSAAGLGGGTGTNSTSMSTPGCVVGRIFLIIPERCAGTGVSRGAATGVASTGTDGDAFGCGGTAGDDVGFTGVALGTAFGGCVLSSVSSQVR